MRYNVPVFFVKESDKVYNPDLGEWVEGNPVIVKKYVNKTHMNAVRQQAVFGDVKSNRFILRLQRPYTAAYDYIELYGKRYTVDTERCPGDRQSLVVIKNGGD